MCLPSQQSPVPPQINTLRGPHKSQPFIGADPTQKQYLNLKQTALISLGQSSPFTAKASSRADAHQTLN